MRAKLFLQYSLFANCIDICTNDAKAVVGKITGTLQIRVVAPNCTSSHFIHCHMYTEEGMKEGRKEGREGGNESVQLKTACDKAVKKFSFIKS